MMNRIVRVALPVIVALFPLTLNAMFCGVEYGSYPIERVIKNLERRFQENPSDKAKYLYALARAHALAAVQQSVELQKTGCGDSPADELNVFVNPEAADLKYGRRRVFWEDWSSWDSMTPDWIFKAKETPTSESLKPDKPDPMQILSTELKERGKRFAKEIDPKHVKESISYYKMALDLQPENLSIQLGLGWIYDIAGEKEVAKRLYRGVIQQAWKKEKNGPAGDIHMGDTSWSLTYEAAYYLLFILDPKRDAHEIRDLKTKIEAAHEFSNERGFVTPIILPVSDRTELEELVDRDRFVRFDMDGRGDGEWQWVSPDAAFLVYLDNGEKSIINSGRKMFGNVTFWLFWNNGYEALSSLDDDADGVLSGAELKDVGLWRDRNQNGATDPDEVITVEAFGVRSISTESMLHQSLMLYNPEGITFKNARTIPTYDWISRRR